MAFKTHAENLICPFCGNGGLVDEGGDEPYIWCCYCDLRAPKESWEKRHSKLNWIKIKSDGSNLPKNAQPVLVAREPLFKGANPTYLVAQYFFSWGYAGSSEKLRDIPTHYCFINKPEE